jgi:hypothetical protein
MEQGHESRPVRPSTAPSLPVTKTEGPGLGKLQKAPRPGCTRCRSAENRKGAPAPPDQPIQKTRTGRDSDTHRDHVLYDGDLRYWIFFRAEKRGLRLFCLSCERPSQRLGGPYSGRRERGGAAASLRIGTLPGSVGGSAVQPQRAQLTLGYTEEGCGGALNNMYQSAGCYPLLAGSYSTNSFPDSCRDFDNSPSGSGAT